MIAELVVDAVVEAIWRGVSRVLRGRPRPQTAAPRQVVVSTGAMLDRLALYEAWAAAHGLEPTTLRCAELAGTYRGRPTEMVTGLLREDLPRSPEILIRVALPGVGEPTLLERGAGPAGPAGGALEAMAVLLEVDGMRDVGITRGFVRLRFHAFVDTSAFDDGLAAFEHALAATQPPAPTAYR